MFGSTLKSTEISSLPQMITKRWIILKFCQLVGIVLKQREVDSLLSQNYNFEFTAPDLDFVPKIKYPPLLDFHVGLYFLEKANNNTSVFTKQSYLKNSILQFKRCRASSPTNLEFSYHYALAMFKSFVLDPDQDYDLQYITKNMADHYDLVKETNGSVDAMATFTYISSVLWQARSELFSNPLSYLIPIYAPRHKELFSKEHAIPLIHKDPDNFSKFLDEVKLWDREFTEYKLLLETLLSLFPYNSIPKCCFLLAETATSSFSRSRYYFQAKEIDPLEFENYINLLSEEIKNNQELTPWQFYSIKALYQMTFSIDLLYILFDYYPEPKNDLLTGWEVYCEEKPYSWWYYIQRLIKVEPTRFATYFMKQCGDLLRTGNFHSTKKIGIFFYLVLSHPDILDHFKKNEEEFLCLAKDYYHAASNFLPGNFESVTPPWYEGIVYMSQLILFAFPVLFPSVEKLAHVMLSTSRDYGFAMITVLLNLTLLNKEANPKELKITYDNHLQQYSNENFNVLDFFKSINAPRFEDEELIVEPQVSTWCRLIFEKDISCLNLIAEERSITEMKNLMNSIKQASHISDVIVEKDSATDNLLKFYNTTVEKQGTIEREIKRKGVPFDEMKMLTLIIALGKEYRGQVYDYIKTYSMKTDTLNYIFHFLVENYIYRTSDEVLSILIKQPDVNDIDFSVLTPMIMSTNNFEVAYQLVDCDRFIDSTRSIDGAAECIRLLRKEFLIYRDIKKLFSNNPDWLALIFPKLHWECQVELINDLQFNGSELIHFLLEHNNASLLYINKICNAADVIASFIHYRNGTEKDVALYLENCSNDSDFKEQLNLSLLKASELGKTHCMSMLLKKGADPNSKIKGKSALHFAAESGSLPTVSLIVENNADINAVDMDGWSPLMFASKTDNSRHIVKYLLDNRADINTQSTTVDSHTALSIAISNCGLKVTHLLLSHGAKVDTTYRDSQKRSQLHYLLKSREPLTKKMDLILLLLQHNHPVDCEDKDGHDPLYLSTLTNDLALVSLFLKYAPSNYNHEELHEKAEKKSSTDVLDLIKESRLNRQSSIRLDRFHIELYEQNKDIIHSLDGFISYPVFRKYIEKVALSEYDLNFLILKACCKGKVEITSYLMSKSNGSWVKAIDSSNGHYAIHQAVSSGSLELIELLLSRGADVKSVASNGDTPLHIAAARGYTSIINTLLRNSANISATNRKKQTPLHSSLSISDSCLDTVRLLVAKNADVNAKDDKQSTVLHRAVDKSLSDVVSFLLQSNANVNAQDRNGNTPLLKSMYLRSKDIALSLIKYKADVNIKNLKEETPYLRACANQLSLVRLLISKDADVNVVDEDKCTPLHFAVDVENTEIVEFLLNYDGSSGSMEISQFARNNKEYIFSQDEDGCTPLHYSCYHGNFRITEILISLKADVNTFTLEGESPLHKACYNDNVKIIQLLISKKANISLPNQTFYTPLHIASFYDCPNVVKYLMDHNANVSATDEKGNTALHLSAQRGNLTVAKILIEEKANVHLLNNKKQSPLLKASTNNKVDLVNLLLKYDSNINSTDQKLNTPLHWAAKSNVPDVLSYLLDQGANINAQDEFGETPLIKATSRKNDKVSQILMERKADVNIVPQDGCMAIHYACSTNSIHIVNMLLEFKSNIDIPDGQDYTPLLRATVSNCPDIVSLLLEKKSDIEARLKDDLSTPLHVAIKKGLQIVVANLLENKADLNARDINARTPLHTACLENRPNMVKLLIDYKADLYVEDADNLPPMFCAVENNWPDVVSVLLNSQVDVNSTLRWNSNTPLHVAAKRGYEKIVQILLENAADLDKLNNDQQTPFMCTSNDKVASLFTAKK